MIDLPDTMYSTPEMSAAFSGEARLQSMLDFEAALARAEAKAGIMAADSAEAIAERCRAELFDLPDFYRRAANAASPVIPLARMLGELVEPDARGFVHWGATSQDVIDTGMVLQAREGLSLLRDDLVAVGTECTSLALEHAGTPMPGRTLLQHALPITFGLKAAHWLGLATRAIGRLDRATEEIGVVQFGGAAGTLASLGDDAPRVAEFLAADLGLRVPELPWHTDRDRVAQLVAALGITAGAMAKIAGDVALLMQTDVAEATQTSAGSQAGSSTMPHKRNPVDPAAAAAAARLAIATVPTALTSMIQEHERAVGAWQAEWALVPDAFRFTAAAVRRVRSIVETIDVDPTRMAANLDSTGGQVMAEALMMALAPRLGKDQAYEVVAAASKRSIAEGTHLRDAALADETIRAALDEDDIDKALDPRSYLGSTQEFIDRAVDGFARVGGRG